MPDIKLIVCIHALARHMYTCRPYTRVETVVDRRVHSVGNYVGLLQKIKV